MRQIHYRTLMCLLLLMLGLYPQGLRAEPTFGLPDSLSAQASASILVATPSNQEVYTLYGHAGLRVQDPILGLDVTFNYGIFNFDDDFIFRFVQGKTDYIVLPQATSEYLESYIGRGSMVRELVLAVDKETLGEMWQYLLHNIQPENRVYRYNFFYDNCSTRPVAILSEALARAGKRQGRTSSLKLDKVKIDETTWRKEINRLEAAHPWLVLGTDLALGAPTDSKVSAQDLLFLPHYIEPVLSKAVVLGAKYSKPIREIRTYGEASDQAAPARWISIHPTVVALLLLALCTLGFIRLARKPRLQGLANRKDRSSLPLAVDIVLWILGGMVGGILLYIGLGTEHPNTWPNYNVIVFNPLLLLVGAPVLAFSFGKRCHFSLHFFNFVLQIGFILISPLLPQHFNVVVYIVALALGVLSLGRVIEYRHLRVS